MLSSKAAKSGFAVAVGESPTAGAVGPAESAAALGPAGKKADVGYDGELRPDYEIGRASCRERV